MTARARTSPTDAVGDRVAVSVLVAESRRAGNWVSAADWLAGRLNAITRSGVPYTSLDFAARAQRAAAVSSEVGAVDGDHLEPDVVRLPDGTRVCLHLGTSPTRAGWIVERAWERCGMGGRR